MGRPGGFFKKLKAKEKRASSRKQRGTKGASKEDRRRKHNERVELYAAKREAEQLAAVSSSSDDEPSTDSDAEEYRQTKSLRKLQRLLGVTPSSDTQATSHKRARRQSASASRLGVSEDDEDEKMADPWNSSGDDDAENANARESPSADGKRNRRPPLQRRRTRHESDQAKASSTLANDDDLDGEDWRLYLGGASDSDDDDESVDGGLEADGEVTELEEETDDADDVVDKDLLMDMGDADDGDSDHGNDNYEGSEDDDNPLFELEKGDGDAEEVDDDDDDGADLFDDAMMYDGEAEDEEEDEDEEREDTFVEDDDDDDAAEGKVRERDAQRRLLLQRFELSTSSVSVLQQCGIVGVANGTKGSISNSVVLTEKDEWMRKYHLDLHGTLDETPLKPLPVPHAALELLAESNKLLQVRAAERLESTIDKKELGIFFASPEECAAVHPENVAVLATAHAQQHLLHAPFDVKRCAASSPPPSAPQVAEPWTECPPYLHPVLWEKWTVFRAHRNLPTFTAEERGLLDLLQGYADLLDTLHCWQNSESRREIFALHLLNHWFKARSVVLAHDALLAEQREKQRRRRREQHKRRNRNGGATLDSDAFSADAEWPAERSSPGRQGRQSKSKGKAAASQQSQPKKVAKADETSGEADSEPRDDYLDVDEQELELRDRGFSKTRLCVFCPLRNHAYKFVYSLVSILQADPSKCSKLAMFEQDFTEIEEAVDPTFKRRPRDYQRAFEGNIDDSFCVGLRLEPELVHVYSHPLNSDVLLCSPLGLRRRIEKNGDVLVSLSSIEVCLLEDAQMLFQQNWMHVTAVLELLNKRPTDTTHGLSDLRRVYAWALEGKSGRHRQTIMSTDVCNATMLSTFRTASVNNSGKIVLQRRADPGVLSRVLVPVRQHFIRFDPSSLATVDGDRFEFFTKQVYEAKINAMAERDVRIIVFVPSYFDFVRVRNYLHREYRESYVALCEYTSLKQQRRALGQFSDLERPVLLVTERFYYFKRYFVKLAEALIFYSPPMFPEYYASLTNRLVATSPNAFTMTLYCRYDTHELNRLVGTSRMLQLLERDSGVFSFVTS
ncbi:conserved hypothetical protein [Leishmania infantum JPCM5]|uniref:U3 small nucleolar RNA-associated protein 25 n=2 Tax=Leishmania infantum TaxID=5671 RepID=A4HVY4_LEIIN|nr:conserved hypothetical protein [Leishmania infantum JPCM5]CAC9468340.1 Protein_of_uncharacterised_function_(DUF1253)_-_putative [Leishmania infantum]CAM66602.1 conserved hypothetical protein [Leishmania infantum JPCM5]SUZ40269.1 Protein_of_uncharacterised_function_(DUF1253)_-_putative [Leishmania infantum]|eukprot:XP_001464225.1 conserved hypothetical protein [Leishmania infantum JPCM5]